MISIKTVLIILYILLSSSALICNESLMLHEFSECINNERKLLFYWSNNNCTNLLPSPIESISCSIFPDPGTYFGYDNKAKTAKLFTCPPNTYSTGSTLRLSNKDFNWNEVPKEALKSCIWINGNNWRDEACESFILKKDYSGLIMNKKVIKRDSLNNLEFKLPIYVRNDGEIKFSYKKISGKFFFFINSLKIMEDSDTFDNVIKEKKHMIKKGYNNFKWRFSLKGEHAGKVSIEFIVCY